MIRTTEPRIEPTDAELLFCFVEHRSEEAFRQLVDRHGGLVAAVSRRILWHEQDVEDAFQATFLVLVRRAEQVRNRESLAAWLFQVARRIALAAAERRRKLDTVEDVDPAATTSTLGGVESREEFEILAAELDRLPERYRLPLVLCYFEGRSRADTAEHLDCTESAVKARLARGRRLLRARLMRRGVALSVAFAAFHVPATTLQAGLVSSTTSAALFQMTGGAVGAAPSTGSLALSKGLSSMLTLPAAKGTAIAATTLAASLLVTVGVALSQSPFGDAGRERGSLDRATIDSRATVSGADEGDASAIDATAVPQVVRGPQSGVVEAADPFGGEVGGAVAGPVRGLGLASEGSGLGLDGGMGAAAPLDRRVSLELHEVRLGDALSFIGERAGTNIIVDTRAIKRSGVSDSAVVQTPVSLKLDDVTARSALRILLDPLDLEAVPDGDVIRVTLAPSVARAVRLQNLTTDFRQRTDNEERIESSLDERTDIEFVDTPLSEGVEFLAQLHEVPIVIDEPGLSELGLATDEPLNRVLAGVKLESALNVLLEPLELTWFAENEVLVVTSRQRAEAKRETRVYGIGPLVEYGLLEPETAADVLLVGDDNGRAVVSGNVVTITQSPLGHRQTADVLAQLVRAATLMDE